MLLVTNGVWLLTQAVAWEKFEDEIMDELKNRDEKSREKRAIYVNNKLPIDMSLFVNLPISVAFRSVLEGRSARAAASPTEDSKMEHTYDPVIYRPNLKKLDAYFTYLEIKEEVCRQRFLCEMGLDTERFGPIYNLFKNQLR
ncbi:hypothetical protein QYM36_013521 [Artemia franciscana]|uniref:Uncharacterized protein n=2 Tax=Artemia franciscana TaxID=6661 RepID=A0AA88HRX3_ARTSF|nr:hypothetical protein QYM36_013521 [Artemia franciscana]